MNNNKRTAGADGTTDNSHIIPIKYQDVTVATTQVAADGLGTKETNIQTNYSSNKGRFIEGKHFYRVSHTDSKKLFPDYKGKHGTIVWTKRGVARHAKILNTNAAWDLFEDMEDTYFRIKQKETPALPAYTTTQRINDVEKSINILERLGMLDDRDRLYYADSVRNAGLPMLPQAIDIEPVTISIRVNELGFKANSGQLTLIGKRVAASYRDLYCKEPVKHNQYVNGIVIPVNTYTTEHLEIIDQAICGVLEIEHENS